jgi:hypothetical protein
LGRKLIIRRSTKGREDLHGPEPPLSGHSILSKKYVLS